jgi:hypothetical protein
MLLSSDGASTDDFEEEDEERIDLFLDSSGSSGESSSDVVNNGAQGYDRSDPFIASEDDLADVWRVADDSDNSVFLTQDSDIDPISMVSPVRKRGSKKTKPRREREKLVLKKRYQEAEKETWMMKRPGKRGKPANSTGRRSVRYLQGIDSEDDMKQPASSSAATLKMLKRGAARAVHASMAREESLQAEMDEDWQSLGPVVDAINLDVTASSHKRKKRRTNSNTVVQTSRHFASTTGDRVDRSKFKRDAKPTRSLDAVMNLYRDARERAAKN